MAAHMRLQSLLTAKAKNPIGDKAFLRYMGCDIHPPKVGAKVPGNLQEIRDDLDQALGRVRITPEQARMTVMSMVPTKLYAVASAYRPTNSQHTDNNAQIVRIYKNITRLHQSARRDALFVSEKDYSQDFYAATAIREWFRNHYQARPGFKRAQREYLEDIHCRLGACPAVMIPSQRGEDGQPHMPQA